MQGHLQEARASQGVLDNPQGLRRGTGVRALYTSARCLREARGVTCTHVVRGIPEKWIESHVVIRRVKAGVIEQIESLHIEAQLKALGQVEILEYGHVHARLKWAAENISSRDSEPS